MQRNPETKPDEVCKRVELGGGSSSSNTTTLKHKVRATKNMPFSLLRIHVWQDLITV